MTLLTIENGITDSPEGVTDSDADSTADDSHSESDSELWGNFKFLRLTPEEGAQLTISLQGGTSQPASSIKTSTAVVHIEGREDSSRRHSGVSPTVQGSSEISPSGPPPPYTWHYA